MKVSEITINDLADYVRADGTEPATNNFLAAALSAAKGYIKNRTSLTDVEMDEYEISIAVFALVADMYDVRSTTTETATENLTVKAILNLHDKNFL